MVETSGIEPLTSCVQSRRSPIWAKPPKYLIEVGKTGFEPATPWSQTKCSTKLSYFPLFKMARPRGVEPLASWSVVKRSIQLSYGRILIWCRGPESNRYGNHLPQDFKSCASASSATPARKNKNGAEDGIRTRDPNLGKVVFYRWTTSAK